MIYKRKDKAPFAPVTFADGTTDQVWNTFGDQQMDLDVTKEVTKKFIKDSLVNLAHHGASVIRLDAFAYAIKKLDTNDFFVEPEIWEILDEVRAILLLKVQKFCLKFMNITLLFVRLQNMTCIHMTLLCH